tara:strand:- start:580 stop:1203 length:624 start_codon:yes stop_codon:yes gene_type:complete
MNADNLQKKVTIKDFLKSNIKILSTIFFILILIGLFFLWNDYTNKIKKKRVSQNFVEGKVLLSKNNNEDSLKILKEVITEKDETYSPLALYLIIDKNLEKDSNIINEYFDLVISISKLKTEDLNLLKLKKAIHISENSNEKELLDLLNPIINSKSIWRIQSIEFLGDYYFSKKQFKKAEQYYSILLNQENSDIDVSDLKRKMKTIKK